MEIPKRLIDFSKQLADICVDVGTGFFDRGSICICGLVSERRNRML